MFFLLPVQLQITAGYSAWQAGLTLLALTILTLVLSPFGGELTTRFGARKRSSGSQRGRSSTQPGASPAI